MFPKYLSFIYLYIEALIYADLLESLQKALCFYGKKKKKKHKHLHVLDLLFIYAIPSNYFDKMEFGLTHNLNTKSLGESKSLIEYIDMRIVYTV